MAAPRGRTVDAEPATAQVSPTAVGYGTASHDFTLQITVALQGTVGELKEAIRANHIAVDRLIEKIDKLEGKIEGRIEKIDSKLSAISHKLYAAWVVTAILLVVGGWVFKEVWDITKPAIIEKLNAPKVGNPPPATKVDPAAAKHSP